MSLRPLISMSILCCFVMLFICSCKKDSETSAPQNKKLVIAVIPKGTIHEFWKSVHAGAIMAARELDVDIIWKGPLKEDDRESQIAVMENIIARGVSGIVLAPLDDTALREPVLNAQRAGIPVVIFDSGLKGKEYVSYVATDNFKGGQVAGEYMGQLLAGKGKIAVLRYSEGSDSTTSRENGFIDAISKFKDIQIICSNQYAGVTTESALKAAENMFARFTGADGSLNIDGMFCAAEPPTLGVLRALDNLGAAGKVKFVGFDTSEKMVLALRQGHLHGFVVQDPVKIGYLGVKTMVAHLRGTKVDPRIDTGCTLVTPQNIDNPDIQKLLNPDIKQYLDN
jgi:ribose transport system substrate-binding protein